MTAQIKPYLDNYEQITKSDYIKRIGKGLKSNQKRDLELCIEFLKYYGKNRCTFRTYRNRLEIFLQYTFHVKETIFLKMKSSDIIDFIEFCKKPPESWCSTPICRFLQQRHERVHNPLWRPFEGPLHEVGFKLMFAVIETFYNYLILVNYTDKNPVVLSRKKTDVFQKIQEQPRARRFTKNQIKYIFSAAKKMAAENPHHERTLFIVCALYGMYLRISELTATPRWTPKMNHFYRDHEENWWFETVGKGNKRRTIAVSDSMLEALTRWRKYLNLSVYPGPNESTPLLVKLNGEEPMVNTSNIYRIVKKVFDVSKMLLQEDGYEQDACLMEHATPHWFRHTGISDDIEHRPREHVRDDAGHSSFATTDRYIHSRRSERHSSARNKTFDFDDVA